MGSVKKGACFTCCNSLSDKAGARVFHSIEVSSISVSDVNVIEPTL